MQNPVGRRRNHSFSPCKPEIGVTAGLPPEPDFSWSSLNYSSNSKSLRGSQRGFLGSVISCFTSNPHSSSPPRGNDPKGIATPSNNSSSFSGSRTSTISSSSQSKLARFSGSCGASNDTRQITRDFSIADICKATGNYSAQNVIGDGGFGTVYKGKLKDGSLIAVKRAKKTLNQHLSTEFKNEIQTLSKVEHQNLVRFLGWLEQNDERIIVVEYVGNGTLRQHLDGIQGNILELAARIDIAIDVAHAVTYLHMYTDHPIIHRDIKASNILLTENFRAKVADFGFARLGEEDSDATHISTQVKGTAGYLDPEYIQTFQLTEKSDVYSFGVLLVEIVTGRRPIELGRKLKERITTQWVMQRRKPALNSWKADGEVWNCRNLCFDVQAMQRLKEGDAVLAMDPMLRRSPAAIKVVERVLRLAGECLAKSRKGRPSMRRCAEVLWRIRRDYRETMQTLSS